MTGMQIYFEFFWLDAGKRSLAASPCGVKLSTTQVKPGTRTIPRRREALLKWNGWGYNDSKFKVDAEKDLVSILFVISYVV